MTAADALFDESGEPTAHARATDPQTSHDAARSVTAERIRKSQEAVLNCLRMLGGRGTDVDVIAKYRTLGMNYLTPQSDSGIRTRRCELVRAGLVVDTGDRVKLDSGRKAIVWAAA